MAAVIYNSQSDARIVTRDHIKVVADPIKLRNGRPLELSLRRFVLLPKA